MKRQATYWEGIFANYISDKESHLEYIKNSQNSTAENSPSRKSTKVMKRHYTAEDK